MLDTRGGVEVLHDVSFRAEPGQMVALVGSSGAGKSTIAQLVPRLYDVDSGAVRLSGVDVRDLTSDVDPRRTLGMVDPGRSPVPRVGPRQPAARPARGHRGRALGGAAPGPARRPGRVAARRARHGRRRARLPALRRRAATADDRPAAAGAAAGRDPRRGDRAPRLDLGGGRAGGAGRGAGRADGGRDRAPAVDHPGGRPHPGHRGRPDRRARHASRTAGRRADATRSCTAPSSTRAHSISHSRANAVIW